jgi:hypothetical protein
LYETHRTHRGPSPSRVSVLQIHPDPGS